MINLADKIPSNSKDCYFACTIEYSLASPYMGKVRFLFVQGILLEDYKLVVDFFNIQILLNIFSAFSY